jgi:uncharacterized RDD family membrane protein YckC
MVAGLIDLGPVIAIAFWRLPLSDSAVTSETLRSEPFALWMLGAVLFYILHTLLGEALAGRTVGKLALGLRTIGIDGRRPTFTAVLLRNVFRVIDVFPGLPLVLLILFSPLRQRLGDVVAGTVVIVDRQGESPGGDSVER